MNSIKLKKNYKEETIANNLSCKDCFCYICLEIISRNVLNINGCECVNMKICLKCLPKYINKFGLFCTVCKNKFIFTKREKIMLGLKRPKKIKKRKKANHKKRRKKSSSNSKKFTPKLLNEKSMPNYMRKEVRKSRNKLVGELTVLSFQQSSPNFDIT
jgi:hypothetical protein